MNMKYWLALAYSAGIGPSTVKNLLAEIKNIADIFTLPSSQLQQLGLSNKQIKQLQNPPWREVETALTWSQQTNHHILTWKDPTFPPLLKEIAAPPLVLFVHGDTKILKAAQLAIVGSRNPTPAGEDNAFAFAKNLAEKGITITSGLALGIDAASHKGAIAANGKTIAVMGTGINRIYPARNQKLAQDIIKSGGALVSEFPLDAAAKAEHFPQRNRIVSGLSLGTLVVEANFRSGSLITARLASEQGREVFAIPGSIHNPLARGAHALLRQGAKLVETADDIIEELGPLSKAAETPSKPQAEVNYVDNSLDDDYLKLLEYIGYETTAVDFLVAKTGFSVSEVSSMLLVLELQQLIVSVPGGYIREKSNAERKNY